MSFLFVSNDGVSRRIAWRTTAVGAPALTLACVGGKSLLCCLLCVTRQSDRFLRNDMSFRCHKMTSTSSGDSKFDPKYSSDTRNSFSVSCLSTSSTSAKNASSLRMEGDMITSVR